MQRTLSMQAAGPGVHSCRLYTDGSTYSAQKNGKVWELQQLDGDGFTVIGSARTLKEIKQLAYRFDAWNRAALMATRDSSGHSYSEIIP